MKYLVYFISVLIYANCGVSSRLTTPRPSTRIDLLGSKECTWGPSFWCNNITTATGCRAVKHCIQTVWEHQTLPTDTDSVCETCLKMVKQARDQLLSNETEGEIKQVLEGSCNLIPIKIISKECRNLVDDFIPELIDSLASQMNPQVVCSVAGLCNNERIDRLIDQYLQRQINLQRSACEGCHKLVDILEDRFDKMTKDEILQGFLRICGRMSSLSDACSNIVVTYFKEIYQHLQNNLNSNSVCLLAGVCSAQFHTHAVKITPLSKIGFVPLGDGDDLPCELCEQLVIHLRDLLVSNTTEIEFQKVLQGLCNQTGQFKDECLSLVNEYYPVVYDFLVNELNSTVACEMIGICPQTIDGGNVPIVPLLPVKTASKTYDLLNDNEDDLNRENAPNGFLSVKIIAKPEFMQLPIERLFPQVPETYNRQVCIFCQYFLHYLQNAITNPATEEEIKRAVDKACEKLPLSVNDTCVEFVNTYGDAAVALLAQEIDPSVICPLIKACPADDAQDVEIFNQENVGKDTCPLCLFAVTELEEMVKDEKTEKSIRSALDKLCTHFSGSIATECQDFVDRYADSLVNMLIDDLKPQQVCVYIKLCNSTLPQKPLVAATEVDDMEILTNEIPDDTINGQMVFEKPVKSNQFCIICEFAMDKLQKLLENKTNEAEIKSVVLSVCDHLPKSVKGECTDFVNKYADVVIQLLIAAVEPEEICTYMDLCSKKVERIEKPLVIDIPAEDLQNVKPTGTAECTICKLISAEIENIVIGSVTKAGIVNGLYEICDILPSSDERSCEDFVSKYGDSIADMILAAIEPDKICHFFKFCDSPIEDDLKELKPVDSPQCAVCKLIMAQVEKVIIGPTTKPEIINGLYDICNMLPSSEERSCQDFVSKYGDSIANMILAAVQPSEICSLLMLCDDLKTAIEEEISDCSLCEAVYFNFNYLKQTRGWKILPEHVCNPMTKKYVKPCLDVLEKHAFAMSMYSFSDEDTTTVCEELEYCKGNAPYIRTQRATYSISKP